MQPKSIFQSITFWGSVVSFAGPYVAKAIGAEYDAQTGASIAAGIVAVIGFGITVYGRFKAAKPVTVSGK